MTNGVKPLAAGAAPSLILGTAGHIDHGKSALVKALTGTDPDRLAEEKRRGITIELGFARLELPNGQVMGVVDVPGHERFVRQMVAGASGVDIALLVIAADDGIMPQTIEHMSVLRMLHIPSCVVAITKADKADAEWRDFLIDEVRSFLASSPYPAAPVIPVSVVTGEGIPELLHAIADTAGATRTRRLDAPARLPVDRAFSIKGAGTVVTGTLWSGCVRDGDALELVPQGATVRIRGIQSHGEDVEAAFAGSRVALNLPNVRPAEVAPGSFLAAPGLLRPHRRLDAFVEYLGLPGSERPLKNGSMVRVAFGTGEVLARLILLDGSEALIAGSSAFVQLRLEAPLAPLLYDSFVLRSRTPVAVIGGGTVLALSPRHRARPKPEEQQYLEAVRARDFLAALSLLLSLADGPVTAEGLAQSTGLLMAEVERALAALPLCVLEDGQGKSHGQGCFLIEERKLVSWMARIENGLVAFHAREQHATGLSPGALRHMLAPTMDEKAFAALVGEALRRGFCLSANGEISHARAGNAAREEELRATDELGTLLRECATMPPAIADLPGLLNRERGQTHKALGNLEAEGRAVRITGGFAFDADAYGRLREAVISCLGQGRAASAAELRDAMGVSRKYAIPLLEHFDAIRLTRRDGDERYLV
jgi:selenocysteine-specific elongation factor